MHGDEAAVAPVENVIGFLILGGKLRAGAKEHAGRAADADRGRRGEAVEIILRPLGGAFAEAGVTAANGVEDADRAIPGRTPVPFHVGVEAEELAISVEGDVVGIALARGEQLDILAVLVHAGDEAARRNLACAKAVAVFSAGEDAIVLVVLVRRRRKEVIG